MRRLVSAVIVTLLVASAQAQVPAFLIPSPLGVALTVGKWIYDASTQEQVYYIEVIGVGDTAEQSQSNGFRLAVEQAIGTIISSETQVDNGRLTRDEIISYASGHVDKFQIVNQENSSVGVKTTMKVWVRRSTLSNRLLNRSEKSGEIDGPRASIQLSTINQERQNGDRLVTTVLNDFPKRAFNIELKSSELKYGNRQGMLEIPLRVTWNDNYLSSLWAALDATSQKSSNPQSVIIVKSNGWFKDFGGTAKFDDMARFNLVINTLIGTRPAVLITLKSAQNTVLVRQCFRWSELDHIDGYNVRPGRFVLVTPYGNSATVNSSFKLDGIAGFPATPELLANASQITADIVPGQNCPN